MVKSVLVGSWFSNLRLSPHFEQVPGLYLPFLTILATPSLPFLRCTTWAPSIIQWWVQLERVSRIALAIVMASYIRYSILARTAQKGQIGVWDFPMIKTLLRVWGDCSPLCPTRSGQHLDTLWHMRFLYEPPPFHIPFPHDVRVPQGHG